MEPNCGTPDKIYLSLVIIIYSFWAVEQVVLETVKFISIDKMAFGMAFIK